MPILRGLPGTSGDVEAVSVGSRTAAITALRRGQAVTAAGDHGALNVWTNGDGHWCCEFMRRQQKVDAKKYAYMAAVDAWLRRWFPCLSVLA